MVRDGGYEGQGQLLQFSSMLCFLMSTHFPTLLLTKGDQTFSVLLIKLHFIKVYLKENNTPIKYQKPLE